MSSFEIASPCRKCQNIGGTKEVCSAYCPELDGFLLGLSAYTKKNIDCFAREADLGALPLKIETYADMMAERQLSEKTKAYTYMTG